MGETSSSWAETAVALLQGLPENRHVLVLADTNLDGVAAAIVWARDSLQ